MVTLQESAIIEDMIVMLQKRRIIVDGLFDRGVISEPEYNDLVEKINNCRDDIDRGPNG